MPIDALLRDIRVLTARPTENHLPFLVVLEIDHRARLLTPDEARSLARKLTDAADAAETAAREARPQDFERKEAGNG